MSATVLNDILGILLGLLVVLAITAATGYFVAQEFAYVTVDRSKLRADAQDGDDTARRALRVTERTSFMLSGAQLGITVTGLVVGYVAEPMIGTGVANLLGFSSLPEGLLIFLGTLVALGVATVIQMVYGELLPKNLAIARPEEVARRLAVSTLGYLRIFGWFISFFDNAANLLLRAVGIEPVHDRDETATAADLEAIIEESRRSGELPEDLSILLDRVLDFADRQARDAMIPRPDVDTVPADENLTDLLQRMSHGHSRYPVIGQDREEVIGVLRLRDVLALVQERHDEQVAQTRAAALARPPVFVPDTLPLPDVLSQLYEGDEQLACVLDEFGGLAGIVTVEDIAEELVGEIADEHDNENTVFSQPDGTWQVPGTLSVEELERMVDADLPDGRYSTVAGLILDQLGRLPQIGDEVMLDLGSPSENGGQDDEEHPARYLALKVDELLRRVPGSVRVSWSDDAGGDQQEHMTQVPAGEQSDQQGGE